MLVLCEIMTSAGRGVGARGPVAHTHTHKALPPWPAQACLAVDLRVSACDHVVVRFYRVVYRGV